MSKTYLKISNPGVSPIEGFTLLGASTTRQDGVSGTTGQFGSGSKHMIRLCLSQGLTPVIYCGLLKLEFFTTTINVNDGLSDQEFKRICYRVKGQSPTGGQVNRTEETSMTLSYGTHDWTELSMGLREVVSNALDRARREYVAAFDKAREVEETAHGVDQSRPGVDALGHIKDVVIEVVEENQVRASKGETRVFIEYTEDVKRFHQELGKRFLHFSDPSLLEKSILPKVGRNFSSRQTAVIYREGVYVREVSDYPIDSLFDYNFKAHELEIDESRKLDDYQINQAVARLFRDAPVEALTTVIGEAVKGHPFYEVSNLGSYYLKNDWNATEAQRQERAARWEKAWKSVAGEDGILCSSSITGEMVRGKGLTPRILGDGPIREALKDHGIQTDVKVLSLDDTNGVLFEETPEDLQRVVDDVWAFVELVNKTNGRQKPPVKCFTKVMDAGTVLCGFWDRGEEFIAINRDLTGGRSKKLLQVVLEELVHHVTLATDNSRDFQSYLLDLVIDATTHFGLL